MEKAKLHKWRNRSVVARSSGSVVGAGHIGSTDTFGCSSVIQGESTKGATVNRGINETKLKTGVTGLTLASHSFFHAFINYS